MTMTTAQSETGRLSRLLLKHPREAFASEEAIARQWRDLNFTAAPDFARAIEQYDHFAALVGAGDTDVVFLPEAPGAGLDSVYVRDATVVCDRGAILCRMGKPQRAGEPDAQAGGATRPGRADRRRHRIARPSRGRRRAVARFAHDRRRPRVPHQ